MFHFFKTEHHSQSDRVLELLKSKPIVSLVEVLALRPIIANHTARISDLRNKGHNIECREWYVEKHGIKEKHAEYTYKGIGLLCHKKEKKYTKEDVINAFNAGFALEAPNADVYLLTL